MPRLAENFEQVVAEHTAGDPVHADVKWTNLTHLQIAAGLDAAGTPVSTSVVRKLLVHFGYRRRKASKVLAMGSHPDSNTQFEKISRLKRRFLGAGQPVISMDTKKKELLGNFARPGRLYTQAPVKVYDHDFGGRSRGVVIPHGIYDLARNCGHITLGTSHDTSQFAIDSLRQWWRRQGRQEYSRARCILLLCDSGGSNGCRTWLFKSELQRFADDTGIVVRVAHYPPYKSKYNPIDHRMFPHVDRTYRGLVLRSVETIRDLIRTTSTAGGLEVTATILRRVYDTGLQVADTIKQALRCVFDRLLPAWNYSIHPHACKTILEVI